MCAVIFSFSIVMRACVTNIAGEIVGYKSNTQVIHTGILIAKSLWIHMLWYNLINICILLPELELISKLVDFKNCIVIYFLFWYAEFLNISVNWLLIQILFVFFLSSMNEKCSKNRNFAFIIQVLCVMPL